MSLKIGHNPDIKCCNVLFRDFKIDLNQAVKNHMKPGEKLTNKKALKILKEIKWKADVKAFISNPIFLFTTSITGLILSTVLPFAAGYVPLTGVAQKITVIAIHVFSMLLGVISGGVLGYTAVNTMTDTLPTISKGYRDMSAQASKYIQKVKNAEGELNFIL